MTTTVSAYVFMSPVSSSMMAPASERIAAQFGVTNSTLIALQTSMFLGGYGMYKISDLLSDLTERLYSCRSVGVRPTQRSIRTPADPSASQLLVPR